MSDAREQVDRRRFLKVAGASALLGAAGTRGALARETADLPRPPVPLKGLVDGSVTSGRVEEYDFEPLDRVGTGATKWDGARADTGAEIEVGMGIADMDFRVAPCITDAVARRSEHESWGYYRWDASYKDAIVDWNHRRYGIDIDPDSLVWMNGVHPSLIAAIQTFSPPGSGVLMTTPIYNGFYSDLRFTRTVPEDSPMILEDGVYSIDWDDFERRARRVNTFILCNPQNPTGNSWSRDDLERMGEICLRHRVVVLADEIHCDFMMGDATYTPFASLDPEIVANSLTFKAASKTFGIPAMKVAWYYSTNRDLLDRVGANSRRDLTPLGMAANRAALEEGEPWFAELLPYMDENHDFIESFVRENIPLMKYRKPEGTFLAWLDVADAIAATGAREAASKFNETAAPPRSAEDVFERWLAKNARVHLYAGTKFGTGGEGHMRMTMATSRQLIALALGNIAEVLDRV